VRAGLGETGHHLRRACDAGGEGGPNISAGGGDFCSSIGDALAEIGGEDSLSPTLTFSVFAFIPSCKSS
jgi:hypothetical protein